MFIAILLRLIKIIQTKNSLNKIDLDKKLRQKLIYSLRKNNH